MHMFFYIYILFMLVAFRTAAAGDVNLFDAEVDKYAAFRDLSTSADNTTGARLSR